MQGCRNNREDCTIRLLQFFKFHNAGPARARRRRGSHGSDSSGAEPECCVAPPAPDRRRGPARRVPESAFRVARGQGRARRPDGGDPARAAPSPRARESLARLGRQPGAGKHEARGLEFNVGRGGSGSGPGPAVLPRRWLRLADGRRLAAARPRPVTVTVIYCPGAKARGPDGPGLDKEFLDSSSSTSRHLETIILWILRATYFEISKFSSYEEKSKISSSMQHHVFSMRFSTIDECFPIIKFWLICMKENIKRCI